MTSLLDQSPARPVIQRLKVMRQLADDEVVALEQAIREAIRRGRAGEDLICEGDCIDSVRIILSGWLCRYKALENGRRQILNFVLPGETCDAYAYLLSRTDHSIGAITPVVYADIKRARFEQLIKTHTSLGEAFWCETLLMGTIQREWAVNLGRRMALERVAHILCELFERLRPVGLLDGNTCSFPLTQMDLADATGLSVVHLNRTLQELRSAKLISLRERILRIEDLNGLKRIALFSPTYLYLYQKH
ncbi:Crp/Fnr family transcriptional regulator [Bradyrhizobium sp. SYSU BS000235]|uniref:Crp/Fnr family transcriptional regulator n=1 Tax=Bradyrhizobium sp. SYSU BS000235 TaxID=3411332 RepID=UPI003C71C095